MGSRRNLEDQKRSFRAVEEDEEDEEEEEEEDEEEEEEESESKRIRAAGVSFSASGKKFGSSSGTSAGGWASTGRATTCQADNCTTDMTEAKRYHRRHKVCEFHAKAQVVLIDGIHQRFCQQCSRSETLAISYNPSTR
ncbi:hypothetical protein CDL15_Pgr000156 [Punica granatum]|uniref:SBP-type domain-containing protein n=1 Tax=Punica granatum TaxID=22663 RepID=A0A218Y3U0_PUNGR|nr:hypothetical protein CDL15_Pgr000156 [Punica granatum]